MADQPRFSPQELKQILQEAATRDVHADRESFTHADLIEAGAELGIAPESIRRVAAEQLARRSAPIVDIDKPFDTLISLNATADRLVLDVPPVRSLQAIQSVAVGLLVAAMSAGISVAAIANDAYPALIGTLPIVAAGAFLTARGAAAMGGVRLEIDRTHALLTRKVGKRSTRLVTKHIRPALGEVPGKRPNEPWTSIVAIEHGTRTFVLLEGYSEAERRWVKAELDRWLGAELGTRHG